MTARTVLLVILAGLFYPATSSAVTAIGCGSSPAPRLCTISRFHARTNHYRVLTERPRLVLVLGPYPHRRAYESWLWQRRRDAAKAVWTRYQQTPWLHGPWYAAAMCVHSKEGAWNSNTGNGYYGGLQFDLSTWQSNGGAGRPDLAAPREQLRIAYLTWQRRGWQPWPATAAACGLL